MDAARPVGCWAPKDVVVAIEQDSGRDRLNIHGAIDLETGRTVMKDVLTMLEHAQDLCRRSPKGRPVDDQRNRACSTQRLSLAGLPVGLRL